MIYRLLEEESLPDNAVADFIINLLFAGNETTAKTMAFAIYFLTQCPKAMKQLQVHNLHSIIQKSILGFFLSLFYECTMNTLLIDRAKILIKVINNIYK